MGIKRVLAKYLFGEIERTEYEERIVDGIIIDASEKESDCLGIVESKPEQELVKIDSSDISEHDEINGECTVKPNNELGFLDEYILFMQMMKKSDRTIKEYCYDIHFFNTIKSLDVIEKKHIEWAIKKLNKSTARRKISSLRSFSKWQLSKDDYRLFNIITQINVPKVNKRIPSEVGSEGFKKLVSESKDLCRNDDRRGLWLGLMLCCGLRPSEIKSAKIHGNTKIIASGRLLPAPTWLIDCINKIPVDEWQITRERIWQILKKMEIGKLSSLRHTYAFELVRNGYSLEEVGKLLGHANISNTMIYSSPVMPEGVNQKLNME